MNISSNIASNNASKPATNFACRKIGMAVRVLIAACGIAAAGAACALEIKLPSETATLRPSTQAGAANAAQCLMCHSADYMSSQPPMGHAFWEAEVNKMIKTYGAPIPPDQVPAIAEYLNSMYGADAQKKAGQK
jgi:hypothetical protein